MATLSRRLPTNAAGEFFVDASCIDCDTCRWMAPRTFDEAEGQARVHTQPRTAEERREALLALIACPTGSIGSAPGEAGSLAGSKAELLAARSAFPVPVHGEVHHCGWHSRKSFGAASYLVRRPPERGGNVLVDSPRFSATLARRLEELGGVATLFLTHADDVADHRRFRERFGCTRVLHRADVARDTAEVEVQLEGTEPVQLDPELLAIPVPGHTRGSTCLLFDGSYLFTGDHLAWSPARGHLYAFRGACWYDWGEQVRSMERLARHDFEWVLPGHGRRAHLERSAMRAQMATCIRWMRSAASPV